METHVIESEKMEALAALATTNVKISEARSALAQIKQEETAYITIREKKALESIQKLLVESEEVLKKAFSNYTEVNTLAASASGFAQYLVESHTEFEKLQDTFNEYTTAFEASVKATYKQLEQVKQQIKLDQTLIKADQEAINKAYKNIATEKVKIKDGRETLERAINRLKQ